MLTVVKVGGALVGDGAALREAVARVAALEGDVVVVHGGGAEISALQERLELPVRWHEGLRITSPEGMRITAMVLSGWMNKRVVQAFEDQRTAAAGISGEDGSLLRAVRARGGDLGEVGQVVEVRPHLVRALLDAGFVPVVSPVSRGPEGGPLNVNADEAAVRLAVGLGADRILLVSDVPGVLRGGLLLRTLEPADARALVEDGVATGGMRVKLARALDALEGGVEVAIGDAAILREPGAGTVLLAQALRQPAGRR